MVNVRRANLGDLDALVALRIDFLRQIGNVVPETDTTALARAIRSFLSAKMPKDEFVAWVADVDGRIVGTSGLVVFESLPVAGNLSGLEAYVMNMYTVAEWRGRGIATALMRELIGFVRGTDSRRIWLISTGEAVSTYEKLGFFLPEGWSYMELAW